MADTKLKHRTSRIDTQMFFYDGSKPVKAGVITIPSGRTEWAGNAYLHGYVLDPETGLELTPGEVRRRVLSKATPEPDIDTIATAALPEASIADVPKPAPKPRAKRKRKTATKKTQ